MKKLLVLFTILVVFTASRTSAQTIAPLDIHSDAALVQCSAANGLAGWLSHIEPNGDYVGPANTYCIVPPVPETWHLDAGLDVGRAFSIVDGQFVPTWTPSVTLLIDNIEIHTASYFYRGRWFEHDTHVRWYQREDAKRRWSVFADAAHLKWPGGSQITGSTGLRWRLR